MYAGIFKGIYHSVVVRPKPKLSHELMNTKLECISNKHLNIPSTIGLTCSKNGKS